MQTNLPVVGVFDSGIGGLTVLDACVKELNGGVFLYLGDHENAPYGNLAEARVYDLVKRGVQALIDCGAEIVVLACNTATAVCIDRLRAEFPVPIVGTEPALALAAKYAKNILLLATERTVKSKRVRALVNAFPSVEFTLRACPDLAGEIERGRGAVSEQRLRKALPEVACDGVVLGCTHYPLVKDQISAFYSAPCYDSSKGVANRLKQIIFQNFYETQGMATTNGVFLGNGDHREKPNKSLHNFAENVIFNHNSVIYFLKNDKFSNKTTYEHLFLFQSQQKNQKK